MTAKEIRETITFSCEPELHKLISAKKEELGYQTKSQMIRDALKKFFDSENVLEKAHDTDLIVTLISVVFNHHDSSTLENYIHVQHELNVSFSTHFHLPSGDCIEILLVKNRVSNIKKLIKNLRAINGLKDISYRIILSEVKC